MPEDRRSGEDVGEPGLGIDVVEATGRDHRQYDGGTVGAALAAGECPVAPSQGDAAQRSFSGVVAEADPAIFDEAGKGFPAPEHLVDRLQDLGRVREGFALSEQPGVHVVEKRLASLLAYGTPLVGILAVDGAFDLASRRLTASNAIGETGLPFCPSRAVFSMSASSKKPRRAWARQNAGLIGIAFLFGSNNGSKPP